MHHTKASLPLLLILAVPLAPAAPHPLRLHVSAEGDSDRNSGLDVRRAVRTLAEARRRVRAALARQPSRSVRVEVGAGSYFDTSLVFTDADSPRSGATVTWAGAPGAATTLYGGERITGWTPWKGSIWRAVLPPRLVDGYGRARFRMLVQGGRSAWLARAPDYGGGYLGVSRSDQQGFTWRNGSLPDAFDCLSSRCQVFVRAGYSSDIRPVASVNHTARQVLYAASNGTDPARGELVLAGALELLDDEGEWAVRGGAVYFWPYGSGGGRADPNAAVITAPARSASCRSSGRRARRRPAASRSRTSASSGRTCRRRTPSRA